MILVQPPSLVKPSPMAKLLQQLALDDLQPTASSEDSLDSSAKTLEEEPGTLVSSPIATDFPSLLSNSRDSTLNSMASQSRQSREGSCIIPAGPTQSSSTTSLHKPSETLPLPQQDPINDHPCSLHIPAPSSTLQRGTSILRSSSSTDVSSNPPSPPSPTSPGIPSVKFAPLPEIERSKKRKHSHPLGVAARSQMLARRKQMMRESEDADRPPKSLWQSDEEEEDPLITLGHMVKLASIGIWRKVSRDKKTRAGMQERGNSDPVSEIARPVTGADTEDEVLAELVDEDASDDKTLLSQTEATTAKTPEDEAVVVQTPVMATEPIPMALES